MVIKDIVKIILSDPSLCKKWEVNKLVNPITGRKIKKDGPTYNKLMKQCNRMKLKKISPVPLKPSPGPTKVKPIAFGFTEAKKRAEKVKEQKLRKLKVKKIIKKAQGEAIKKRIQKREERQERKIDTPVKIDKTKKFLERLTNFVNEMNSTNKKKQEVLKKYKDLRDFVKYVFDPENEFGISSEDYKKFEESGKKKSTRVQYVDILKLLEDLDDYKKDKALLHLYNFINKYQEYKELILNIVDKQLPIKQGPVKSIKLSIKKDEDIKEEKVKDTRGLLDEVEKMVYEMNQTNKTTVKKLILEKYLHLKKIVKYVYDPDIVYGITSKNYLKWEDNDKKKKSEILGPIVDLYKLLDALSERKITGDRALLEIYHFINQYRIYKQTILNILDKSLKIRLSKTTISDVFPKLFSIFEPVLANKFKQSILDKTSEDWYISRKLDGVRCLIVINKNKNKVTTHSRTGKNFTTLKILEESLLNHIDEFETNVVLDGEVVVENEEGQESFKGLMEQIKKKNYSIPNPQYRVFDMITAEAFAGRKQSETLSKRNEKVVEMFKGGRIKHVRALAQIKFTPEKFEKLKKQSSSKNWEGLMIRRDVPYKGKRTNDLLKYKTFHDDEFKVIGMEEGTKDMLNKDTGLMEPRKIMAAVIINYGNNTKVGSGFSDEERLYFIKNPQEIIGKIITVQYFEKTEDSLRFPTFKILHGTKRDT